MSSINFPRLYAPRHRDRAAMRAQRDRNRHKTLDAPVEQSRRRADVGPESVAVWLQHLVDAVGGRPLSEILGFTNQGGPAYGIEQVVKMIEALDPDAHDDTGDTCRYFANKVIAKLREIDAPWKSVETGWLIERADSLTNKTMYWAGISGHWNWTAREAIWFSRQEDASKVAENIMPYEDVRIVEHVWN